MSTSALFVQYGDPLRQLCERAGAAILEHYASDEAGEHSAKHDESPLTAADLASHEILVDGLARHRLPVLSEESPKEVTAHRLEWPRYWLVDPLDGTKEFLERTGEFTINIALVEQGRAVLGAVSVPGEGVCYLGIPGEGAWVHSDGTWHSISARRLRRDRPLVVHTSRRHRGPRLEACLNHLGEAGFSVERRHAGSALKFCELARGAGDLYPRFAPCSEWDTAAGQALLEGAGGAVIDQQGAPLRYNQRDTLLSPHFLAIADPVQPLWEELLASLDG